MAHIVLANIAAQESTVIVGVPREIKSQEYRVGLTPDGVRELVDRGHTVIAESHCGDAIGLTDVEYQSAGATLAVNPEDLFAQADLIVKVKEPQTNEIKRLRPNQILFTYLHLAADRTLTEQLLAAGVTGIAYETVRDKSGQLPLLTPMSEVAGRMAVQAGAHQLEKNQGGRGVLLGGVPGVAPGNVLIIGGGVVGFNAAQIAVGMGANVTLLDKSIARLQTLSAHFNGRLNTLYSTTAVVESCLPQADIVIGAVLIPGAAAPKVVTRHQLQLMKPGSVMVDVAIDQGGCFETSRATTHQQPTYVVDGIIHYCVANIPAAVARTATFALTNATLPYVLALADRKEQALIDDPLLRQGLNTYKNQLTCAAVGEAFNLPTIAAEQVLNL